MAHQPPFTNEQTNQEASGNSALCMREDRANDVLHAREWIPCAGHTRATLQSIRIIALPYVQAWNLDIQKTLPWGIVVNLGYNGRGEAAWTRQIAPRAIPSSPGTDPSICNGSLGCYPLNFDHDETASFSKFNAGTVRVNKRLSERVSMGPITSIAHSIDDAGALGGVSGRGVQNWQNCARRAWQFKPGDVRHSVSGNYLYELPFGNGQGLGNYGCGLPYP